jgi:hypothetical protein
MGQQKERQLEEQEWEQRRRREEDAERGFPLPMGDPHKPDDD